MTYEYHAQVIRVVDGDTLDLSVDLGFRIRMDMRVRLFGLDAPELSTPEGKVLRDELTNRFNLNPKVVLNSIKDGQDKYGRYLARIVMDGGVDLNEWLIMTGRAVARTY